MTTLERKLRRLLDNMKKITKEILTYIIMFLLSIILIILGVVLSGDAADIMMNIGLSIISTVIVYFILKFCAGDPMDSIVEKVDQLSDELTSSVDMLKSTKETGIINSWNNRSDCPVKEWINRIEMSDGTIRILCYAMSFLVDDGDFDEVMLKKASEGKKIQILLGKPTGECIKARTIEERIEGNIADRIERAAARIDDINKRLSEEKKIEVKYHDTPLYASIYIMGSKAIITPQLYATRGALAPILEIQKTDNKQCMYIKYLEMFNEVWKTGSAKNV